MASLLVLCLIPQLGADAFPERQLASATIAKLLPAGLVYVEASAVDSPDLEIRRRCKRLIRDYDRSFFGSRAMTWIDSLPSAFPDRDGVMRDYLNQARQTEGYGTWETGWPDFRLATAFLIADLRADGVSRGDLISLMEEMSAGDKRQLAAHAARKSASR